MNLPRIYPKEIKGLITKYRNISFLVKDFEEIKFIVDRLYFLSTCSYYRDEHKKELLEKFNYHLTNFTVSDTIYLDLNYSSLDDTFLFSSSLWSYTSYPIFKFNNYSEIKYLI